MNESSGGPGPQSGGGGGGRGRGWNRGRRGRGNWQRNVQSSREVRENISHGDNRSREGSSASSRGPQESQSSSTSRGPKELHRSNASRGPQDSHNFNTTRGSQESQSSQTFRGPQQQHSRRTHQHQRNFYNGRESEYLADPGGRQESLADFRGYEGYNSRWSQDQQWREESNYYYNGDRDGHDRSRGKQRKHRGRGGPNYPRREMEEHFQQMSLVGEQSSSFNDVGPSNEIYTEDSQQDRQRNGNKPAKSRTQRKNNKSRGVQSEEQESNMRSKLTDLCVKGLSECMVCLDRVKQHHSTWDCRNCYQVCVESY